MAAQKLTHQSEETPEIFWTVFKNGQAQKFFFTSKNRVNYYPYGKTLREYFIDPSDPERFVTTQHERDVETGLDYRGARFYDADVARFLSLDPLSAEFPNWSSYTYVFGNPILLVDKDGKEPINPIEILQRNYSKTFAVVIKEKQRQSLEEHREWGGMFFTVDAVSKDQSFGEKRIRYRRMTTKAGKKHGMKINYQAPTSMSIKKGYTFDKKSFRRVGEWHTHDGEGAPSAADLLYMGRSDDITFKPRKGYFQIVSTPSTVYGLVVVDAEKYAEFQAQNSFDEVESVYQMFWAEIEGMAPDAGKLAYTEYALKKTMEFFDTGVELYEIFDNNSSGEEALWVKIF